MSDIAIIGAGVSGLSVAQMLRHKHRVTLYERAGKPGGLIACESVQGVLYHKVGGHVFNSRRQDVRDWFAVRFDMQRDFCRAVRNAVVYLADGTVVGYPIENHLYQLPPPLMEAAVDDLLAMGSGNETSDPPTNFEDFLRRRFGDTLYTHYFAPYNYKVWRRPLCDIPMDWLEGKLPMPTVKQILMSNMIHEKEMNMVHSSFFYPKRGGSQFIADTLAEGLEIQYGTPIGRIEEGHGKWRLGGRWYDAVVYTANVRDLPGILHVGFALPEGWEGQIRRLESHGTTSVLCEVSPTPYSWIYMPDERHGSHRIICTGNFSPENAPIGMSTATVEFTGEWGEEAIRQELEKIPYAPRYLAHHYEPCTYPVQTGESRPALAELKACLQPKGFFLLGRFAEWEYYNMDAAIGAAMDLVGSGIIR